MQTHPPPTCYAAAAAAGLLEPQLRYINGSRIDGALLATTNVEYHIASNYPHGTVTVPSDPPNVGGGEHATTAACVTAACLQSSAAARTSP